ncbi:MAG: hypothetical protein AB2563_11140 [Candidatus Thiodiazotropha endolucinida]
MCDVIQFPHKTESETFCCRGSLELDRLHLKNEELEEENEMLRTIISGMLADQEGLQL